MGEVMFREGKHCHLLLETKSFLKTTSSNLYVVINEKAEEVKLEVN